jgi:hypothetical protein
MIDNNLLLLQIDCLKCRDLKYQRHYFYSYFLKIFKHLEKLRESEGVGKNLNVKKQNNKNLGNEGKKFI